MPAPVLDEQALLRRLSDECLGPRFRRGIEALAGDPFHLAFFLASVSQGEGLGENAVGLIGEDALARRIDDLKRVEAEERAHKERTLCVAQELFPEFFEGGLYRYGEVLDGRAYYVEVLERNRARLKERGRHSRLNLYLTTTFGYEIMVMLLYPAVAEGVRASSLPEATRSRVVRVLEGIVEEESTHLGVAAQHEALLASSPAGLPPEALGMLAALEKLEAEDYVHCAELSVRHVAEMMERYDEPGRRAEIEARAAAPGPA